MLQTASYSLTLVRDSKPDSVACIYVVIIDLGDAGKHSDGGVFGNCLFHQILEDGDLDIPEDSPLPGLALCNYFITTSILTLSTCLHTISGTTGPALPYICHGGRQGISSAKVLVTSLPWKKCRGAKGNL